MCVFDLLCRTPAVNSVSGFFVFYLLWLKLSKTEEPGDVVSTSILKNPYPHSSKKVKVYQKLEVSLTTVTLPVERQSSLEGLLKAAETVENYDWEGLFPTFMTFETFGNFVFSKEASMKRPRC